MNPPVKNKNSLERGDIRYLNLRYLIDSLSNGSVTDFAERVGKSRESVARFATKKHLPSHVIGDKFAEDIERALTLDSGWMDQMHGLLPNSVPPELIGLLQAAPQRLAEDALSFYAPGTLPIIDWATAGTLIDGGGIDLPPPKDFMLAPVPTKRGYFLQVNVSDYMPYIMAGMLLQVDQDKHPTAEDALARPTFVLVKRPDNRLPVLRLVRAYGDLLLYGSVTEIDPTPYYDPSEWQYGGMVVMRLIP